MSTSTTGENRSPIIGKSRQRPIQRPRIPDRVWHPALTKAASQQRPIGHVLTELLEDWLQDDTR